MSPLEPSECVFQGRSGEDREADPMAPRKVPGSLRPVIS